MPRVIPSPDALVQKTIATLATSTPPDFELIVSHICSSLPRDAPLPPHERFVHLLHATLGRLVKCELVIQTGSTYRPNPNPPSNRRGKPPPTKLIDEEEEQQQSDEPSSDDVHHEPYAGRHLGCPLRVPHDLHLGDKIAVYFADPHSEWFEGTICTINKQRTKQDNVTATFIDGEASLLLSTANYGPENMWVLLHSACSEDASDAPSQGHPGNISLPSIAEGPARMGHSSLGTASSKVTRPDLASMPSPSVNAVRHTASPPSRDVAAAASKQDPADRLRALAATHVSNNTVESPPAAVAVRPSSAIVGQDHQPPKPRPTLHHWSVCELGRFRGKVFHLDGIRNGKTIVTSVVEPANIDYEAGFITTSSGTVYRLGTKAPAINADAPKSDGPEASLPAPACSPASESASARLSVTARAPEARRSKVSCDGLSSNDAAPGGSAQHTTKSDVRADRASNLATAAVSPARAGKKSNVRAVSTGKLPTVPLLSPSPERAPSLGGGALQNAISAATHTPASARKRARVAVILPWDEDPTSSRGGALRNAPSAAAHAPASARKRARAAVTLPRARDTEAKDVVRRPQRDRRPTSDAWLDPWKDLTKSSYNYSAGSI